ncbi:hypothetical protein [Brevundimonas sp.]|jgi:hypothetical protein|uniref:hypothetical protein n=1 Tax=Brevundimonas sp. TaxID=1871086 RepID=UPI002E10E726|nr:hypothetical protein [Brevundimonas sp.]
MTWQERERRKNQARQTAFAKIITAYGYGCLAAGAGIGALDGRFQLSEINALLFAVGLALHALAIYIAPEGSDDADQH